MLPLMNIVLIMSRLKYYSLLLFIIISFKANAGIELISFYVKPQYLIFGKSTVANNGKPIRTNPLNPTIAGALVTFQNTFPGGAINVQNIFVVCKKNNQEIILNQSITPPSFGNYFITFTIPLGMEGGQIYLKWDDLIYNSWQTVYSKTYYTLNNNYYNSAPLFRYYYPIANDKLNRVYSTKSEEVCTHRGNIYPFCFYPFAFNTSWKYEGYLGFLKMSQEVSTVPIYCYVNPQTGDNFISIENLNLNGYINEGILGYGYTKSSEDKIKPTYRYFNGKFHYDTSDFNELGFGGNGYVFEKISFFMECDQPYIKSPLENMAGIDIAQNDWVYYWGKDGKFIVGTSTTINKYNYIPTPYLLPAGKNYKNIISIGMTNANRCYAWYKDGSMSAGTSTNLGSFVGPKNYLLPLGKSPSDIVAITIDKMTDWCTAWYNDGTASVLVIQQI